MGADTTLLATGEGSTGRHPEAEELLSRSQGAGHGKELIAGEALAAEDEAVVTFTPADEEQAALLDELNRFASDGPAIEDGAGGEVVGSHRRWAFWLHGD